MSAIFLKHFSRVSFASSVEIEKKLTPTSNIKLGKGAEVK